MYAIVCMLLCIDTEYIFYILPEARSIADRMIYSLECETVVEQFKNQIYTG